MRINTCTEAINYLSRGSPIMGNLIYDMYVCMYVCHESNCYYKPRNCGRACVCVGEGGSLVNEATTGKTIFPQKRLETSRKGY